MQFVLVANDQGKPPRTAQTQVTVQVERDQGPPRFVRAENVTITDRHQTNTFVAQVVAEDDNPKGVSFTTSTRICAMKFIKT